MRFASLFLALMFAAPAAVYAADDIATQINKACLRHAVSLVARLKADVIGELSQSQSDRALNIATESCEAYFMREFGQQPIARKNGKNGETDADAKEKSEKSSMDKWLDDSAEKKKGQKRIERMHRY